MKRQVHDEPRRCRRPNVSGVERLVALYGRSLVDETVVREAVGEYTPRVRAAFRRAGFEVLTTDETDGGVPAGQMLLWPLDEARPVVTILPSRLRPPLPPPATDSVPAPVVEEGDALGFYGDWPAPTVIVSDGPYGLASFPGDPPTPEGLERWYEPHARMWYQRALPSATLWFWNSEQGWANCHRMLEACGWEFRNCHIWDKGIAHVAGNCNTKTIRKFPVVTEVCVQYTRKNTLPFEGAEFPLRDWLRKEWARSGLPFSKTNEACGVVNAATRKYFTQDHLWYFPPPEMFEALCAYANQHGRRSGAPYFTRDGKRSMSGAEWGAMRAKFRCEVGVSNVWREPAVRGQERLKRSSACIHMNQKPLALLDRVIGATSDAGDVVWEPFGGLCSASLSAWRLGRRSFAAEINPAFAAAARERLSHAERN